MFKTFRDRAIVLRSYNLGEADRIVVFLGQEQGQFRAVAKGIRRSKSKFGARLASFNLVDVQCRLSTTSDLHTVIQVESLRSYSGQLANDYGAYSAAKAIGEVSQKVTDSQVETLPQQFALLEGAIHALANHRLPAILIAASYLLRALSLEGWSPHLATCAVCGTLNVVSQNQTLFDSRLGGQVCENCAPIRAHPLEANILDLLGKLLAAKWGEVTRFPEYTWLPAYDLAAEWTEWNLEKRLNSRTLLRQYFRLEQA